MSLPHVTDQTSAWNVLKPLIKTPAEQATAQDMIDTANAQIDSQNAAAAAAAPVVNNNQQQS